MLNTEPLYVSFSPILHLQTATQSAQNQMKLQSFEKMIIKVKAGIGETTTVL